MTIVRWNRRLSVLSGFTKIAIYSNTLRYKRRFYLRIVVYTSVIYPNSKCGTTFSLLTFSNFLLHDFNISLHYFFVASSFTLIVVSILAHCPSIRFIDQGSHCLRSLTVPPPRPSFHCFDIFTLHHRYYCRLVF